MPQPNEQNQAQKRQYPILHKINNVQCLEIVPIVKKGSGDILHYRATIRREDGSNYFLTIKRADKAAELARLAGQGTAFAERNRFSLEGQDFANAPKFNMVTFGSIHSAMGSLDPEVVKKYVDNPTTSICVSNIYSLKQDGIERMNFTEGKKPGEGMTRLTVNTFDLEKSVRETTVKDKKTGEQQERVCVRAVMSILKSPNELKELEANKFKLNFQSDKDYKNAQYHRINFSLFMPKEEFEKVKDSFGQTKTFYTIEVPTEMFNNHLKYDQKYGLQAAFNVTADNFTRFMAKDDEVQKQETKMDVDQSFSMKPEMNLPQENQASVQVAPGM